MAQLADAIRAFVSPDFQGWKILKEDGSHEPFDALLLFQSFIESEIPLPESMSLFDAVTERLRSPQYHIESDDFETESSTVFSYDLIRSAIITEILQSSHPQAPYWLSNYDTMFAVNVNTHERGDDSGAGLDEVIDARNASQITSIIKSLIEEGGEISAPRHVIDILVQKIIRYLRYCGFHRIERSFLREFVRAISFHSSKSVFNIRYLGTESLVEILDRQEDLLISAKSLDETSRLTIVKIISENVCRSILNWAGHITLPSVQKSKFQLLRLLNDARSLYNEDLSENKTLRSEKKLISGKILEMFSGSSIEIDKVTKLLNGIIVSERDGLSRQMQIITADFISIVRSLIRGDFDISNIKEIDLSESVRYLGEVYGLFNLRSMNCDNLENSILINCGNSFHAILSLARTVTIVTDQFLDGGEVLKDRVIGLSQSTILFVVTDSPLRGDLIEIIKRLILTYRVLIAPIDREAFERQLSSGHDVRDLVIGQLHELFPFTLTWQVNPFEKESVAIPSFISLNDKERLRSFVTNIDDRKSSSACQRAGAFFETRLRSYCLLIWDLLGRTSERDSRMRFKPEYWDIGGCIHFLRQIEKERFQEKYIAKYLVSKTVIALFEKIGRRRNMFSHNDVEMDDATATQFINEIGTCVEEFCKASRDICRVVSFPNESRFVLFNSVGADPRIFEGERWKNIADNRRTEFKFKNPDLRVLGYSVSGSTREIFFATGQCTNCRAINVRINSGNKCHCAAGCKAFTEMESDWLDLITSAVKELQGGSRDSFSEGRATMRDSGWLKPLGEGVAQALGAFGAPLKVYLTRMDMAASARLEEKIDGLIQTLDPNQFAIALADEMRDASAPIQAYSELAFWIKKVRSSTSRMYNAGDVRPFSFSRRSEEEVIFQLGQIYEGKPELFRNDVAAAGVSVNRIRWTGVLEADIRDVVTHLRSMTPEMVFSFSSIMLARNSGSSFLTDVVTQVNFALGEI